MKSITGKTIKLLPYQEKIISKIKEGKDYILCGPTGSGKTIIAYYFSGILDPDSFNSTYHKVIICSPLKALSNERYLELKNAGLDVGIETGDIKINESARILCVTQEIYLLKYHTIRNCRVIIDEFHYMFSENERTKSYMDSICKTSKSSNILLLSATIASVNEIKEHLNLLSNRDFNIITWTDRPVPIEYDFDGIELKNVKNSIIFSFSVKNIEIIKNNLLKFKKDIAGKDIINTAEKWKCVPNTEWFKGIGIYHGKLLPKYKHCIEELYRNEYIDNIIGTDALALGVNLPAKTVIFSTFKKQSLTSEYLSVSLFQQLSGRAGRYGYHKKGIVTYTGNLKDQFIKYTKRKLEKPIIQPIIDIATVLKNNCLEKEIQEITNYIYPRKNIDNYIKILLSDYYANLELIQQIADQSINSKLFIHFIKNYYISEFNILENIEIFLSIINILCKNSGILLLDDFLENMKFTESILQKYFNYDGLTIRFFLLLKRLVEELIKNQEILIDYENYFEDNINMLDHTVLNL